MDDAYAILFFFNFPIFYNNLTIILKVVTSPEYFYTTLSSPTNPNNNYENYINYIKIIFTYIKPFYSLYYNVLISGFEYRFFQNYGPHILSLIFLLYFIQNPVIYINHEKPHITNKDELFKYIHSYLIKTYFLQFNPDPEIDLQMYKTCFNDIYQVYGDEFLIDLSVLPLPLQKRKTSTAFDIKDFYQGLDTHDSEIIVQYDASMFASKYNGNYLLIQTDTGYYDKLTGKDIDTEAYTNIFIYTLLNYTYPNIFPISIMKYFAKYGLTRQLQ